MSRRSYRLTVEGELGDLVRQQAFEGTTVRLEEGNTILVARDQAELMALLRRVSDLGLTVLSATGSDERARPAP
jgi:hypothetical protein